MKPLRSFVTCLALLLSFALIAAACGGDGDDSGDSSDGQTVTATDDNNTDSGSGGSNEDESGSGSDPAEGEGEEAEQEPLIVPVDTTTTTTAPPPGEEGEAAPPEPEPQFGGTLRVAVEAETDNLNPTAGSFAVSAYITTYPVLEPLAYWDAQGNWVPLLAESFTKVEGNPSAWQMKLREGVRFHDGSTLDADDVIATFEAQLADFIVSLAVRPVFPEENAITKIDDLTVQYNPIHEFARFPTTITSQLGQVLPSEYIEAVKEDPTLSQKPIGTGPYMIESRTQDEVTVLVRNPDYWAADSIDVYLDRIEIYVITDTVIAAERLNAGDIDLVVTENPEATLTLRESDEAYTIENVRLDERFAVINSQVPPFDDIRARQALTHATPRDTYVNLIVQGVAPAADTMFHDDLIWNNPDVVQLVDMPELAGPLVDAYCADVPDNCSDGKINMEFQYSGPSVLQTRVADLMIDGWEDYFNVTEQELLQDDHIAQVITGQYNVVTWRQFGEPVPTNDMLWLQCSSIQLLSLNFPRYCNPDRDELLFEQRSIDDLDRRVEIWHQVQEEIRDSYTYIFLASSNWTIGARNNVQNICGNKTPEGVDLFCNNQGRVMLQQIWLS